MRQLYMWGTVGSREMSKALSLIFDSLQSNEEERKNNFQLLNFNLINEQINIKQNMIMIINTAQTIWEFSK